jgi:translation initiation factor 3 subunit L
MPLEKLANYMNTTVDGLESHLLCFKHKMMNVVWTKGTSALQGEFQSESEVSGQRISSPIFCEKNGRFP